MQRTDEFCCCLFTINSGKQSESHFSNKPGGKCKMHGQKVQKSPTGFYLMMALVNLRSEPSEFPVTLLLTTCTACTKELEHLYLSPFKAYHPLGTFNSSIITAIIFSTHLSASFKSFLTRHIYHGEKLFCGRADLGRSDLFLTISSARSLHSLWDKKAAQSAFYCPKITS